MVQNTTAIANDTVAVLLSQPQDVSALVVLPDKSLHGLGSIALFDEYSRVASRFGVTIIYTDSNPNIVGKRQEVLLSQRLVGCVAPCTTSAGQAVSLGSHPPPAIAAAALCLALELCALPQWQLCQHRGRCCASWDLWTMLQLRCTSC